MARTYNDIYYNDDENSTAEILDDMKKLAESVDQQIGSIKSFNNDTSQFIEQVTPLMNTLSEQVIDMHQLADTMFTELEQVKEENKQLREDLESDYEEKTVEGTVLDVADSAEYRGKIEVKGNTEQKQLSGKNLWGGFDETVTSQGVAFTTNRDGSIIVNGTASGSTKSMSLTSSQAVSKGYVKTLLAGTYTISKNTTQTVEADVVKSNGNTVITVYANETNKSFTLNEDTDIFVRASVLVGDTANETVYIQLEAGSTSTDFEEYCGGIASPNPDYPQEIEVVKGNNVVKHVGKNFFNASIQAGTFGTATYTVDSDGKINQSYSDNSGWSVTSRQFTLEAGTYTLSVIGKTNTSTNQLRDITDNINLLTTANNSATFTIDSKKVLAFKTYGNIEKYPQSYYVQIEKGSTATSYEPYRVESYNLNLGSMELCKIGEYQDILFKNVSSDENYSSSLIEGAWYKKEEINKLILDGTEQGWSKTSYAFVNNQLFTGRPSSKCSHFTNRLYNWESSDESYRGKYSTTNADGYAKFMPLEDMTTAEFKAMLASKTPSLYITKEPTYTQITDTTLITQLEALRKAKWFKGVNHWWTETENLEPNLKGTYKQSNNLRIQALEQAVIALGGV